MEKTDSAKLVFFGIRTIAPEENCLSVRVRVWFRVSVRNRVGGAGQFSSGAIVLKPFFLKVGISET